MKIDSLHEEMQSSIKQMQDFLQNFQSNLVSHLAEGFKQSHCYKVIIDSLKTTERNPQQ